jgi:hypothetical protein
MFVLIVIIVQSQATVAQEAQEGAVGHRTLPIVAVSTAVAVVVVVEAKEEEGGEGEKAMRATQSTITTCPVNA